MGRAARLVLWVLCWPAGLAASLLHRRDKREAKAARQATPAGAASDGAAMVAVADRLEAAGVSNKRERLLLTRDAMQLVHQGDGVDTAVRCVLEGRK